jgi:hypothetical protein
MQNEQNVSDATVAEARVTFLDRLLVPPTSIRIKEETKSLIVEAEDAALAESNKTLQRWHKQCVLRAAIVSGARSGDPMCLQYLSLTSKQK